MTGRERAARTRTSTALRRIAVLSGERRAIIIRSARRDVCARSMPPAPFLWRGTGGTRTHEGAGRTARALCASRTARTPRAIRSDAAVALTAYRRKYTTFRISDVENVKIARWADPTLCHTVLANPHKRWQRHRRQAEIPAVSSRFRASFTAKTSRSASGRAAKAIALVASCAATPTA
jgi:hypothetical protein